MKLNTTDFLRKAQFPPMLALGTLPVFVIVMMQAAPEALPALLWLMPGCIAASWLCMLLPGKTRVTAGLLCCAGITLLSFRLLPITQGVFSESGTLHVRQSTLCILIPLMLSFLILYSLQFAAYPREREVAFNWYAIGVIAHLAAQLMDHIARRSGPSGWDRARPFLTVSFILFMMLVLLSMNRSTMQDASLGRQRIPLNMRRRNVAITLSLLLGALIIAGIPAIVEFAERVWSLLFSAVLAVIAFIARLLETEDAPGMGGAGGGMDMMPYMEYQEPSLLAIILEKIIMAAALIGAAILFFFALRQAIRVLHAFIRRIAARLSMYMTVASLDYVDEITDTRGSTGEASNSFLAHLRRMVRVNERNLSPGERIRYRYHLLLRRHPDWHESRTARENLPDDAAALYEAARYSGREVSADEAEAFKKAVSSNG